MTASINQMVIANSSDKELINELKKRNYAVIKKEFVRTASVIDTVQVTTMFHANWPEHKFHMYDRLGRQLGNYLVTNGAVPIIEEMGDSEYKRNFRASITVIVADPQFDWPYELRMKA